jgi:hypothetical protein
MFGMSLKSLGLVALVGAAVNVCESCSTQPRCNLTEWSAVDNGDGSVTVTVKGEEGWCTNFPPYRVKPAITLRQTSDGIVYPYDYDWEESPYIGNPQPCGVWLVTREHQEFIVTFEAAMKRADDTFRVSFKWTGEGIDPDYSYEVESPLFGIE